MKIFNDIRPFRSEDVCAGEGTVTTTDDEGVNALFDEVERSRRSTFYRSKCR
jgi:hypothetical protein